VQKGEWLTLHIADPQHILGQSPLLVGAVASAGGRFQPARSSSASPVSRNYEVLVPANTPVKLRIDNPSFTFKDAQGNSLNSKVIEIPAQYNSSGTNRPIVLTVVGGR